MKRALNFSAGPSALPTEVLQIAQKELLNFQESGISIMEGSHRAKMFDDVHNNAIETMKRVYKIPKNFEVLFMQGGASMQFAFIPLNLKQSGNVEFVDTGVWSSKAIKEAKLQGLHVKIVASSQTSNYDHIPQDISFSDNCDYGYITSNNTIYGTQYKAFPSCKNLVIDASSDLFSYPIEWEKVGLLYGGAQKNAGPSGVTIVIIRKDLLEIASENIPSMFKYINYAKSNSMFNTPPTFSIYLLGLVMQWLEKQGGIEAIQKRNTQKANLLYNTIDTSSGFYIGHAKVASRSFMNVSFTLKNQNLEEKFLKAAQEKNMIGLKGHRSLGGLRASIYNAVSLENVEKLSNFMEKFAKENS